MHIDSVTVKGCAQEEHEKRDQKKDEGEDEAADREDIDELSEALILVIKTASVVRPGFVCRWVHPPSAVLVAEFLCVIGLFKVEVFEVRTT